MFIVRNHSITSLILVRFSFTDGCLLFVYVFLTKKNKHSLFGTKKKQYVPFFFLKNVLFEHFLAICFFRRKICLCFEKWEFTNSHKKYFEVTIYIVNCKQKTNFFEYIFPDQPHPATMFGLSCQKFA